MKIGLITPTRIGLATNPGTGMITAGIKHLCRLAVEDVSFDEIEMYEDLPSHWERAKTCDVVLFCGNPRFVESPTGEWWDFGIWPRLVELSQRVRVVDAWSGSCVGLGNARLSVEDQTALIRNYDNAVRFDAVRSLAFNIARDSVMANAYKTEGISHALLPCSSWWARQEFGFEKQTGQYDTLVLADVGHHSWIAAKIKELVSNLNRPRIIAGTWSEYHWAIQNGFACEFTPTPSELFKVFAESRTVRGFRIHSIIPAASMGCAVGLIATDSRYLTCEPFEIPCVTLDEWNNGAVVRVKYAKEPKTTEVVRVFRGVICPAKVVEVVPEIVLESIPPLTNLESFPR